MSVRLLSGFKLSMPDQNSPFAQAVAAPASAPPSMREQHGLFSDAASAIKRLTASIGQLSPPRDGAHRKYSLWGGK